MMSETRGNIAPAKTKWSAPVIITLTAEALREHIQVAAWSDDGGCIGFSRIAPVSWRLQDMDKEKSNQ